MNIENSKAQMRKGLLEFCILLVLHRGEAYPSDIIASLKNSGLDMPEGTLYPLLTRLKNEELLTYRWEESTMGPPRKYFSITEKGQEFLRVLNASWSEIQTAVSTLSQSSKP
ncbi:MAG: PadR family transcriptional regulator [Flavobacteriales bacterium]|nr:PadR family transcriptional regulator [Flavobacteriales bacterium]